MSIKLYAIIGIMLLISVGWLGNDLYHQFMNKRYYDGLFLKNITYSTTKEATEKYDKLGDWVCVNVKGMSYKRALEVCQHETFHEVWGECGEKKGNISECLLLYEKEGIK